MHIQYNYANVESSGALQQHVEQQLESQVGHLYKHLTGFEVHIADENSSKKHGPADKRCTIEARPRGARSDRRRGPRRRLLPRDQRRGPEAPQRAHEATRA